MENLKEYLEKENAFEGSHKRLSYWIWAMVEGKLYVYGRCFNSNEEAYSAASRITVKDKPLDNYKIEGLPTIDIGAATQYIKGKRLESTGDLLGSTQRAKHQF